MKLTTAIVNAALFETGVTIGLAPGGPGLGSIAEVLHANASDPRIIFLQTRTREEDDQRLLGWNAGGGAPQEVFLLGPHPRHHRGHLYNAWCKVLRRLGKTLGILADDGEDDKTVQTRHGQPVEPAKSAKHVHHVEHVKDKDGEKNTHKHVHHVEHVIDTADDKTAQNQHDRLVEPAEAAKHVHHVEDADVAAKRRTEEISAHVRKKLDNLPQIDNAGLGEDNSVLMTKWQSKLTAVLAEHRPVQCQSYRHEGCEVTAICKLEDKEAPLTRTDFLKRLGEISVKRDTEWQALAVSHLLATTDSPDTVDDARIVNAAFAAMVEACGLDAACTTAREAAVVAVAKKAVDFASRLADSAALTAHTASKLKEILMTPPAGKANPYAEAMLATGRHAIVSMKTVATEWDPCAQDKELARWCTTRPDEKMEIVREEATKIWLADGIDEEELQSSLKRVEDELKKKRAQAVKDEELRQQRENLEPKVVKTYDNDAHWAAFDNNYDT